MNHEKLRPLPRALAYAAFAALGVGLVMESSSAAFGACGTVAGLLLLGSLVAGLTEGAPPGRARRLANALVLLAVLIAVGGGIATLLVR